MPGIRAAHIVRKDILKVDNSFNGKCSPECQKNSIPASLLSLVGMLIKGPTTKIDPSNNQACVTDPLKKNNLPTFSTPTKKAVSKDQAKVKLLKEDCSLFGRLLVKPVTETWMSFFRMKINLGHHPFQTRDSCEEDKKPTC